MRLTHAERKTLAREARRLAFECVEGTAPEFEPYHYCYCALGVVAKRARIPDPDGREPFIDGSHVEDVGGEDGFWVTMALFEPAREYGLHSAVVFPLLSLADALETRRSRK